MKTYYIVRMNGSYMNTFENYSVACELRDQLKRRWKAAVVEIEYIYE